jgi:hypothetical protein
MLLSAAIACVLIAAIVVSGEWPFDARIVPQVVAYTALACISLSLIFEIFTARSPLLAAKGREPAPGLATSFEPREHLRRSAEFFLWCCAYLLLAIGLGILPGLLVFIASSMRYWGRESLTRSLLLAVGTTAFAWVLFDRLLAVPWPQSLLGLWVPALQPYLP